MKAKFFRQTTLLVMMTTALAGCGAFDTLDEVVPDNTQKYRKAETMPPLEIPPDLSTNRINDDIANTQKSSASYAEFEEASTNPLAAKYNITPDKKPALSGEGSSRHLIVPGERELTWQRIQMFWDEQNIGIHRMDSRIGLMDSKPDADGYAYRIRMERGDSDRQAKVYLGAADETKSNAQKNEAMLRQLAQYLGDLYEVDKAEMKAITPAPAPEETARVLLMDDGDGLQSLFVEQDYPTVWDRVGRVLDSKGFSVEERDRVNGQYFVRYIDPFKEIKEEDEGMLDKLAFWRDDAEKTPEEYYYIKLISDAENTRIVILDAEQVRSGDDTARRLLDLIQEQLAP